MTSGLFRHRRPYGTLAVRTTRARYHPACTTPPGYTTVRRHPCCTTSRVHRGQEETAWAREAWTAWAGRRSGPGLPKVVTVLRGKRARVTPREGEEARKDWKDSGQTARLSVGETDCGGESPLPDIPGLFARARTELVNFRHLLTLSSAPACKQPGIPLCAAGRRATREVRQAGSSVGPDSPGLNNNSGNRLLLKVAIPSLS